MASLHPMILMSPPSFKTRSFSKSFVSNIFNNSSCLRKGGEGNMDSVWCTLSAMGMWNQDLTSLQYCLAHWSQCPSSLHFPGRRSHAVIIQILWCVPETYGASSDLSWGKLVRKRNCWKAEISPNSKGEYSRALASFLLQLGLLASLWSICWDWRAALLIMMIPGCLGLIFPLQRAQVQASTYCTSYSLQPQVGEMAQHF